VSPPLDEAGFFLPHSRLLVELGLALPRKPEAHSSLDSPEFDFFA
jgi:hypothetical protein